METVFLGIVARPMGAFKEYLDLNYQTLKVNVDMMSVTQIAFTFCDANGRSPLGTSTWVFNFRFDESKDLFSQEAIDGFRLPIDPRLRVSGIDGHVFGELLMTTGIVLNEDIKWITVLGAQDLAEQVTKTRVREDQSWITFCGLYDYGYLLRFLTSQA